MGGEFFTDFKSSNGIEISWLVQVLSNFKWFRGSPLGSGRWVDGGGGGYECVGVCHACMHTQVCTCMHMHVKHAKHGCLLAGSHLQFLYMCVCVCACACVLDTPYAPRCPHPRATGSPKHQISITLELIKIIQFCFEDSLPLNIPELILTIADHPGHPPPTCPILRSQGNPNRKNYNNSWMKSR